jgi:hypothetical protein
MPVYDKTTRKEMNNKHLKLKHMDENYKDSPSVENNNEKQDCGCNDGNCKPKKKNIGSKLIFGIIILAALAIIGVKLSGFTGTASVKQSVTAPGKVSSCDTSKTKTCDTTKGSSCCSKK